MRFVVEVTEKERDAMKKASREVKDVFKKLKDSFQIKVVKEKK
jgi:hypothetical protein